MNNINRVENDWPYLLSFLPSDLTELATTEGAIVRKREIRDGETLVRLAFAYGYCGMSLREAAEWAEKAGIAILSDVALMKRLQNSCDFLRRLISLKINERTGFPLNGNFLKRRIRLMDASTVSCRGSTGIDWRLHIGFSLERMGMDFIELTDKKGGETFNRLPAEGGDIVIGDRGYAHRQGIHSVMKSGGDVIVRFPWSTFPLLNLNGESFDLFKHLRVLSPAGTGDWKIKIAGNPKEDIPGISGRIVAIRKSEEAANRARQKAKKDARKKGKTIDDRTLEACDYIFIFTTLLDKAFSANDLLQLYRFRWQIELLFKRMKGILDLGNLAAQEPRLVTTVLLTKLLGALLIEQWINDGSSFSPWGFGPPKTPFFVEDDKDSGNRPSDGNYRLSFAKADSFREPISPNA